METPKFILSKSRVLSQYEKVKQYCDIVSYSHKTNPEVGEVILSETDSTVSVHYLNNVIKLVKKYPANRIIFFLQGNDQGEIKEMLQLGLDKFVVDNENDLNNLLEEVGDKKIKLFIRAKVKEHTIHTGRFFVFGIGSEKARKIINNLKQKDNIDLNLHFHRKTQNIAEWDLEEEIENIIGDDWGCVNSVNIGGGIPWKYKNFKIEKMDLVLNRIKKIKEFLNSKGVKLMIEPGRFIAAPSIELHAKIINVYDNNIIVNCSVYNASMDTFIANTRLMIKDEKDSGERYTVKGYTPDSIDIFRYRVCLENPNVGDVLIFLDAGAYNFRTEFCGLEKIPTEIVD